MSSRDMNNDTRGQAQLVHITTRDLAQAKEAVIALLDQLGVTEYLFEVEPHNGLWEVRIDCATDDAWQSLVLSVDLTRLLHIDEDPAVRRELLEQWATTLTACNKRR